MKKVLVLLAGIMVMASAAKYLVRVNDLNNPNFLVIKIVDGYSLILADDSDIDRLVQQLVPYRILDVDPEPNVYLLVYPFGETMENISRFGTVLDYYVDCVLLRTTEDEIPNLNTLKVELDRVFLRPINVYSPVGAPDMKYNLAPDTLIQKMVAAVSQDSIQASILRMQRMYTRYATTDSNKIVLVNWIRSRLMAYGYDSVYFENFDASYGPNVIAIKRGEVYTNWNRYCVIDGHIDDVPSSGYAPGADDNASGTTAMLEAARVMRDYNFENTIRFIGFNAEEQGLIGSYYNATNAHNMGDTILGVLNFDMIGYVTAVNRDTMHAHYSTAVPGCSLFVCQFFQAVADTYTQLKIRRIRNTGTSGGSDHASYWENGYKALCGIERVLTPMYHTTGDTIGPYMYINCGVNNLPFATKVIQTGVAALAKLAVPIHEVTVAEDQPGDMIKTLSLQISPNPFSKSVQIQIQFAIRNPQSAMSLMIYNASGRLVKSFNLPSAYSPGLAPRSGAGLVPSTITWDGTDEIGRSMPAGVYFVRLEIGEQKITQKTVRLE